MQVPPDSYGCYRTRNLERTLNKLKKTDIPERFDETVKKLEVDPYRVSKHLEGLIKHFRTARVGAHYRLYLAICEDCRERGDQRKFGCLDCKEKPDKSVILFDLDPRPTAYEHPPQTLGSVSTQIQT